MTAETLSLYNKMKTKRNFNPDKVTKKQLGPNHRFMYYGETIPDTFEYWDKEARCWAMSHITCSIRVYLDKSCTSTRRLPL